MQRYVSEPFDNPTAGDHPFERADLTSNTYFDWVLDHAWIFIPAQAFVAEMVQSLVEFPPSQTPASFTIGQVLDKLKAGLVIS